MNLWFRSIFACLFGLTCAQAALAQSDPATARPPSPPPDATHAGDAASATSPAPAAPLADPGKPDSLTPKPIEPPTAPNGTNRFEADPIQDGALLGISLGFAALSEALLSTGEVRPQQISSSFDTSSLLGIDRGAISQHPDSNASTYSSVGLVAVVGFAALDPVLSGFREHSTRTALVDAVMYGETLSLTWSTLNLAKVAVRRPRPSAYVTADLHRNDPTFNNSDTDSSLSFFSGHAAICASLTATATYLAFARSPGTARPWVTLIAGTAITTFVSVERVRAGAHFPTDVIAGAMAGAGIGLLVPHLHREDTVKQRAVWVAFTPIGTTGGTANLSGYF